MVFGGDSDDDDDGGDDDVGNSDGEDGLRYADEGVGNDGVLKWMWYWCLLQ